MVLKVWCPCTAACQVFRSTLALLISVWRLYRRYHGRTKEFAGSTIGCRQVHHMALLHHSSTHCNAQSAQNAIVHLHCSWLVLCPVCYCSVPSAVGALQSSCQSALATLRMPSTRNEDYRYTDISPLLNASLVLAHADAAVNTQQLEQLAVPEAGGSTVVLVNGAYRPDLSDLSAVPEGVYVGGSAGAPAEALQQLVSDRLDMNTAPPPGISTAFNTNVLCLNQTRV